MKRVLSIVLLAGMALTLAACGSDTNDTEATEMAAETVQLVPMTTKEAADNAETTDNGSDKDEDSPKGVWESDDTRLSIENDTVTIEDLDNNGNVSDTYWVGSYEPAEETADTAESAAGAGIGDSVQSETPAEEPAEALTWVSTRDPEAEMTCESDTIEFTWTGTDNVYDSLSYSVTNEDGTQKTVTLERTESLGEVAEGIVPDFSGSDDADVSSSASASDSGKTSDKSDTSSAQTSADTKTSDSGSASANTDASTQVSGSTNGSTAAGNTGSSGSGSSSGGSTGSSGSSSSGNSGSSSSSGNSGSSGSSSSSGSGSSSSGTTACSHNYVGNVTKAATCSTAGVKTYTCSKCGASYTESIPATGHSYNGGVVTKAATCSTAGTTTYTCTKCGSSYISSIPATGNHNWQAVYRTESVKVQDAVYEYRVICNNCFNFSSTDKWEVNDHIWLTHNGVGGFTYGNVLVQDAVYENQQVLDHYVCSVCGATK